MSCNALFFAVCLLLGSIPAHAGYALAKPPPGWSAPNGVALYKPVGPMPAQAANGTMTAANGDKFNIGGVRGTTTVNAGSEVPVPFAMRYAPEAASAAASILVKHPALLLLTTAIPILLQWMNQSSPGKFSIENGKIYDKKSTNTSCSFNNYGGNNWRSDSIPGPIEYPFNCYKIVSQWPGWVHVEYGISVPGAPVEVPSHDWPAVFSPKPITPKLPFILPEPLPVDVPVINPSPAPVEQPWPNPSPVPLPLDVPTADPIPIPNTDPQQYRQPWTEIKGSPLPNPANHWRVNLRPKETTTTNPNPVIGPVTDPGVNPGDPGPGPGTPPENPDLCALNPDIVACLKKGDPGTLPPTPIHNENKDMAITKKTGFGPSSGSCPAGQTLSIAGQSIELGYGQICQFATMINPLVIGFAWLSAAFAFFGFARRD